MITKTSANLKGVFSKILQSKLTLLHPRHPLWDKWFWRIEELGRGWGKTYFGFISFPLLYRRALSTVCHSRDSQANCWEPLMNN